MGKVGQFIFGGSKADSKQDSYNQAYPYVQQQYGGQVSNGTGANDMVSNLLGTGDTAEGQAAFENYKNSAGYQAAEHAGTQAITNSNAAKGLLQSGDTLKGISQFGTDLTNQHYNNYLDRLLGLSSQGIQAGGLISGAGQVSHGTSDSSQKPGISKFLGSLLAAA